MLKIIKKHKRLFTPTFVISALLLLIIVFATIFASKLAPYDPEAVNLADKLKGISPEHILGTDKVGRDIFSRVLYGGRTTMISAFLVVLISIVIGIPAGLITGYYGGKLDTILNSVWNIILACPAMLLAFVIMSVIGKGITAGIIALGIIYVPMIARLTRSLTMVEKNKLYVESARALGYGDARIVFHHILPNCITTIISELTLDLAYAILDLAGLSFLGLGVQPPQSDWGYILSDGQQFLVTQPLQAIVPGILLVIVVISLNLISNEIMTYVNPNSKRTHRFKRLVKKNIVILNGKIKNEAVVVNE